MTGPDAPLRFHGGRLGALAPFALFVGGVAWLAWSGAPDERGFWPLLVAALALGTLLAHDRWRYCESALAGMSRPIVLLMIMAWLLAGALAAVMNGSGFVDSLVWLARAGGVEGGLYAAAAFLICCLVSTSTGTSLGTVILCAPLLYPAGAALGAQPVILMGAILGGATFGDNISPVSDTTIASASTQGAEIGAVVRTRLRYALPAAAVALLLYAALGSRPPADPAAVAGAPAAALAATAAASPRGLPMLLVPALVVALLLRRRHLLESLLYGTVAACLLGVVLGLVRGGSLLYVDPDRFAARGLLVEGLERGVGVSIFTILLMGLVAGLEASGLMGELVGVAERRARSPRQAEVWTFVTVSVAVLVTTHSVVALLLVGPFARRAGERFALDPCRRANLLDVTVCTWPFLLPYCIPTILAASTTAAGEAVGMPRLGALEVGLANFHSWALLAAALLAISTGWGRGRTPPDGADR